MILLAAVVGGLISALAVVVGVFLASRLEDRRNARARLEALLVEVGGLLSRLLAPFWKRPYEIPNGWPEASTSMFTYASEFRSILPRFDKRLARKLDPLMMQLQVRWQAALLKLPELTPTECPLTPTEIACLYEPIAGMNKLLRPTMPSSEASFMDEVMRHYREGLDVDSPELRASVEGSGISTND